MKEITMKLIINIFVAFLVITSMWHIGDELEDIQDSIEEIEKEI